MCRIAPSQIASDLRVELLPSPDQWSLRVHTDGQIHAHTVGRNGPVTVRNSSDAQFQAYTDVIVDAEGVGLRGADASVQQQTYLRGMQTDYDGVPLIGSLVRGIAMSKYAPSLPAWTRNSNGRSANRRSG